MPVTTPETAAKAPAQPHAHSAGMAAMRAALPATAPFYKYKHIVPFL
jgi:hypothetical protein